MIKKVLPSFIIILLIVLGTTALSSAFFSDREVSSNNVLASGSIDLKVDNESYYNGQLWDDTTWEVPEDLDGHLFLNFLDIKPNDWGEDTISLHVDDNEAWACVDISLTANDDTSCNEPESIDDPLCNEPNDDLFDGELADQVDFIFWVDDGDNVLEDDEYSNNLLAEGAANQVLTNSWALADSSTNIVGGDVGEGLDPTQTYYIGKAWCFGTMTVEPLTQDGFNDQISPADTTGGFRCDGSLLGNESQTDTILADFEFRAEQHRNNPGFLCGGDTPCEFSIYGGDYVVEGTVQGDKKNGDPVLPGRSDPNEVLGAPDGIGSPASGFYSLGFGGVITVVFTEPVYDGPGNDLIFHEITNSRQSYPEELASVEVSSDGSTYFPIGTASSQDPAGVASLDIATSGLSSILYIRVTDTTNSSIHGATADGYDLDAIEGIYGQCVQ